MDVFLLIMLGGPFPPKNAHPSAIRSSFFFKKVIVFPSIYTVLFPKL